MMFRFVRHVTLLAAAAFGTAAAQVPAADPSTRLREVLPADVAERVLARIATARARQLPAEALENRALKFAARGVPASDIERSITEHADRMSQAKEAIESGRGAIANGDEIDAGADVMRKGVAGADVSALAKSAPSGRSLAVPLFVIGSLIDRGLASDDALDRVNERLKARASDRDLERLPGSAGKGQDNPNKARDGMMRDRPPATKGRPTPMPVPKNPGKGKGPPIARPQ
jgi:hypothetical protein